MLLLDVSYPLSLENTPGGSHVGGDIPESWHGILTD